VDVGFATDEGTVSAVSDVSVTVEEGEIFGLVGESGCGKSTLAMALMGLLPRNASVAGSARFGERDLFGLAPEDLRQLRGDRISMIFQDPMTSLDPTFPIGAQVAETITAHRDVSNHAARERALALLKDVGIPEAERRYDEPPHSRTSRPWSWRTNRRPHWTSRSSRRCSTCSAICASGSGRRSC